ncbi:MAG: M1 family metallopeptidase [Phycisphaerae bacterium]
MRAALGFLCASLVAVLTGCASPVVVPMHAVQYDLDLSIVPETHELSGRASLWLASADDNALQSRKRRIRFEIHPSLHVSSVLVDGRRSPFTRIGDEWETIDGGYQPATYEVITPHLHRQSVLEVRYAGELFQDVSAGEREGAIHNTEMVAHIAPEGVYLSGGVWYPNPVLDESVGYGPVPTFRVTADRIDDFPLVGSGDPDLDRAHMRDHHAWRSPHPIDRFAIVGGPHVVHTRNIRGIDVRLHLKPSQSQHVEGLFSTVDTVLSRYEPLVGRYPARTYKIVDNFFSSGFAFPTFTLLSSAVIDMGERAQTAHGYIDHEMLHCWWGNGILVDYARGNWCESITSFATNYYGHVLDGKPDEARRKRRNHAHFLSRLPADQDKPLATFGDPDGCGRGVAYQKGASVFHLLTREMGEEDFFEAMRRFTRDYLGRRASWNDIRQVCESVHGQSLQRFFDQWVYHGGAPKVVIEEATYRPTEGQLSLAVSQEGTDFLVKLPVTLDFGERTENREIQIDGPRSNVMLAVDSEPKRIAIDPDYHVFRKVDERMITPTTNTTKAGPFLLTILPSGDVPQGYLDIQANFERRFDETETKVVKVEHLDPTDLKRGSVLILGNAAQSPQLQHLFAGLDTSVEFRSTDFSFGNEAYDRTDNALLCTFHHPDRQDGGVTVVVANSETAIPRAGLIPFYPRSVVVFAEGRGARYHDFEMIEDVEVKLAP